jgi:hypothetical protein
MGVHIVELVNNTYHTLRYHNTKTGYKVKVEPKDTKHWENNDWVPSSDYHLDTVPKYTQPPELSDSVEIEVQQESRSWTFCKIADYRLTEWSIRQPAEGEAGWVDVKPDEGSHDLEDGESYVVRINEDEAGKVHLFIYKYIPKLGAQAGHVSSSILESLVTKVVYPLFSARWM